MKRKNEYYVVVKGKEGEFHFSNIWVTENESAAVAKFNEVWEAKEGQILVTLVLQRKDGEVRVMVQANNIKGE